MGEFMLHKNKIQTQKDEYLYIKIKQYIDYMLFDQR